MVNEFFSMINEKLMTYLRSAEPNSVREMIYILVIAGSSRVKYHVYVICSEYLDVLPSNTSPSLVVDRGICTILILSHL